MTVFLPEEGKTTDDVIDFLAQTGWSKDYIIDNKQYDHLTPMYGARPYEVDLKLPRYETESDTDKAGGLIKLMQKMGIHLAFDPYYSEIPNMATRNGLSKNLFVNMMRQKAKIKVNEEGSEAAAVTVAGMYTALSSTSTPPEYPKATFHANRPFVYVIREASSGVILFVGKFTGE